MTIKNVFELNDVVRLKTDIDGLPRIVVSIQIAISKQILYGLACGESTTFHYAEEITKESLYEYQKN